MKQPLVSIIMGVYADDYIQGQLLQAIDSILSQSYSNLELLIADSGSTDTILSLVDSYASRDKRIRLIREEQDTCLSAKLNLCLKHARGEFIARQDDDDISLPERIACQMRFLREHEEISFVGCNVAIIDENGVWGKRILPEFPAPKDFYIRQPFIHPTLLFRRKCLLEVGGYQNSKWVELCEDYDLLLRLYTRGNLGANLQQPLFQYFVSNSKEKKRGMQFRLNESITRWKCFHDLNMFPEALPYVVKPILTGLIPQRILRKYKRMIYHD